MGHTRVIYTDATTAEAITVLKSVGFLETADGGCFLSPSSPIRVYTVWGKAVYYPELVEKLLFTPRIQIHFKCKEEEDKLGEVLQACAQGLLRLSGATRFSAFNADSGEEITPALLKG